MASSAAAKFPPRTSPAEADIAVQLARAGLRPAVHPNVKLGEVGAGLPLLFGDHAGQHEDPERIAGTLVGRVGQADDGGTVGAKFSGTVVVPRRAAGAVQRGLEVPVLALAAGAAGQLGRPGAW